MSETAPLSPKEREGLVLVSGSVNPELAEEIAVRMGTELAPTRRERFSDSEIFIEIEENVRKREVVVIQSVAQRGNFSASDALVELCLMLQAAKLANAGEKTAFVTYFGYGRQDRKAASRTPISARLAVDFISTAGADVIMSPDIHSQQIQGFTDKKFDLVTVIPELRRVVKQDIMSAKSGRFVVAALDAGATKLAQICAEDLDVEMVQFEKTRNKKILDKVDAVRVPPSVEGATIIAFDDLIATGGSVFTAAEAAMASGAEGFYAAAAHGQFSGDGLSEAKDSLVDRFYISNTLPTEHIVDQLEDKVKVVSVGQVLGEAMLKACRGESISEMFNGQHLM